MDHNRYSWEFQYPVSVILESLSVKIEHHSWRKSFWLTEQEKAFQTVKDSGIDVRSYPMSGGNREELVIDPALSDRVSECKRKVSFHSSKVDEYIAWLTALETLPKDQNLTLYFDDVSYFGIGEK